jgi:hypothetical protein
LIRFINQFIIDETIGKIDTVEAKGKTINGHELLVPATITCEIVLDFLHPYFLQKKAFIAQPSQTENP